MGLKWRGCEDVHWIHVAEDGLQLRVFVNLVMKLNVPYKANPWQAEQLFASEERLSSRIAYIRTTL